MWNLTTLIFGQRDAVPVDAMLTTDQARALVEWVSAAGRNLTTVFITHGRGDHFFGIGAMLDRFALVRAVATPCNCTLLCSSGRHAAAIVVVILMTPSMLQNLFRLTP